MAGGVLPARDTETGGELHDGKPGRRRERDAPLALGELLGRALRHQATPVDDPDAIRQMLCFVHEMGREQHGETLVAQALDDRPGGAAGTRVHAGGGLVQKDEAWVSHQRHGQREALLLAAGQPAVEGAGLLAEPDQSQQLVGRAGRPVEGVEQTQHLAGRGPGVDASLLEHDPHLLLQLPAAVGGVETQHRDGAAAGSPQPFQDLDGGGLAGPVGAEQGVDLAPLHLQGYAVHSGEIPITLDEAANSYGSGHGDR